MKIKEADIVEALADSKEVEVSTDKKKLRRKGNKAVPPFEKKESEGIRKREAKAASKEEDKKEEEEQDIPLDINGHPILAN